MDYTIRYAEGSRYVVDVSKCGNMYTFGVWDKKNHRVERFGKVDNFATAEQQFESLCNLYNVTQFIKDVDHDPNDLNIWCD